jgi:hypothetical protein
MRSFSDERADKSFIEVARLISEFRAKNQEYTNEEMAYGLLQSLACMDKTQSWNDFLNEALNECISRELCN